MTIPTAPLCFSCAHAYDMTAHPAEPPKELECAICRGPTPLRVERKVAEALLVKRLEVVRSLPPVGI